MRSVMAVTVVLVALLAASCTVLAPDRSAPVREHLLAPEPVTEAAAVATPASEGPVLLVAPMRAAAGYDGRAMLYRRDAHELRAFARNEWVGPPAQMLTPALVGALDGTGAFAAVVEPGSVAMADWRLETTLLRLHQDFAAQPSRIRLAVRASLIDLRDNRVLFARRFQAVEPAEEADPEAGVRAAHRASERVLAALARACAGAAGELPEMIESQHDSN